MKIRYQDIAALQALGYTEIEARFLYIVATHTGYFALMLRQVVGTVTNATPEKRARIGKSMSRRSGQSGSIQQDGNWYVVRFWKDVAGQERRQRVREKICPISGPGKLSASERERKAKEIIAASGADSVEHF